MVVARITSGLGNQLFIYAAGRALAHRVGQKLKLDVSFFNTYSLRTFRLRNFAIEAKECGLRELRLRRLLAKLRLRSPLTLFRETSRAYDPAFAELKDNTILQGFFQTEKYFSPIAGLLRRDLALKVTLPDHVKQYCVRLARGNPVSVHVRRGDYAANKSLHARFGVLNREYYLGAKREMDRRVTDPTYHIFSDDIAYAKESILPLFGPRAQVVPAVAEDYEHLALMRSCRHHIVANSTFSWWGAWLGDFPDKQVMAPAIWFRNKAEIPADIIPASWSTIENGFA